MKYLLLFLIPVCLFSQEKDSIRLIKGRIYFDENPEKPIYADGVFVTNLRTKTYDVSNGLGEFSVYSAVGDTLFFESYAFEKRKIVVNERIWRKGDLFAHLDEAVVELDEVVVNNWSPFLREQISESEVSKSLDRLYANMGFQELRDVEPQENVAPLGVTDLIPLNLNLGRIYQAIAGDLRRKRTLRAFEKREELIVDILEYYGEDYFSEVVKIPSSQRREFVLFCIESANLTSIWNNRDYLLAESLFEEKAKVYNERLRSHWKVEPTEVESTPTQSLPEASN